MPYRMQGPGQRRGSPGRRTVLAGLGGAAVAGAMPIGIAWADIAADMTADWRARLAALAGRYGAEAAAQEIALTEDGFVIRQLTHRDLVAQKPWPSILYRPVGRANYFAGLPADRITTEHEVWWAEVEPRWLKVEARFYDRRGKRMELLSRRRAVERGGALRWQVRLLREGVPVIEEERILERT